MKSPLFLAAVAWLIAGALIAADAAAEPTRLLRQPDLSEDHLVFVYAGDIWLAERDGSDPRRLTTDEADEGNPRFSPDGSMIAFSARYEGNDNVHVIPVEGGQPRQLTW
ncbi:MAG: hypothetical protein ACOCSR_02480, partial [Wenzhouxiangella sp.]